MYIFFWVMMFFFSYSNIFIFLWVVYVRGRHNVFISIIISCFTCATLIINLYYEAIHRYFLFCEIKNFILFYFYFPHTRLCIC